MISVGKHHSRVIVTCAAALLTGVASIAHAVTGDVTQQVLDQFETFSTTRVKRSTTNPVALEDLNSTGTNLRSCQNSRNGITCLDGQVARQYSVPKVLPATPTSDSGRALFSCRDDALALNASDACQALTVDIGGDVWIAGRKGSNSYNLYEVRRNQANGVCPNQGIALLGKVGNQPLVDTDSTLYCAYARRTGRPVMSDLSSFDGELSNRWPGGRGILAVESGKNVVFFPSDGGAVRDLGSGKSAWALSGSEGLLSATLLQREVLNASPPSTVHTYVLATTTTGRVMWRNTANAVSARQLADANATGAEAAVPTVNVTTGVVSFPRGNLCESGAVVNTFEVRASDTTGRVFMSNRNYCKVFVTSPVFSAVDIASGTGNEKYTTTATFKPEGISLSPGIAVDLTKCATTDGCPFLPDSVDPEGENLFAAARMTQVTLAPNSPANMTVFLIKNIPDCRHLTVAEAPDCGAAGVVVTGPRGTYLNVTPLLPQQVKDLFDESGVAPTGLPPIYISPRYRAQNEQGFFFDALFGVADPNVQFRGKFTLDLDVGDNNLAGDKLGCGMFDKTPGTVPEPDVFNDWDIVTVASERFAEVGGPNDDVIGSDADHGDMLVNKDCFNPTSAAGKRWSLYSYNLELAEDPAVGSPFKYSDGKLYLGELLKQLFVDLRATQQRLVCANVDPVGNTNQLPPTAPLTGSACTTLDSSWVNTNDKINKCINATYNPKSSALDQNCQSFNSQWDPYYAFVQGLSPTGVDPANRVGELRSRMDVIRHVFYDQFLGAAAAQTPP